MEYKRCYLMIRIIYASLRVVEAVEICLDIGRPLEAPNVVDAVVVGVQPDAASSNAQCIGIR